MELEERLESLADSVPLPDASPEEDLARGRARRQRRNLAAAGGALATAAVICTTALMLSGGGARQGASPDFAGGATRAAHGGGTTDAERDATVRQLAEDARTAAEKAQLSSQALQGSEALAQVDSRRINAALDRYRDILREDLDPTGAHIQLGPITNEQRGSDALGTKLTWNGGGMLQVAVGRSLEAVQFFCDGACTKQMVAGARKALVRTSAGSMSVAAFQDDGDVVALTASTSFGNNGTSTQTLGLTVDQMLTAAADPRLNLPTG